VQSPGKSYSLTNPDPQTLRFQVQPGDNVSFIDGVSGEQDVRDQLAAGPAMATPNGTNINLGFQVKLESGYVGLSPSGLQLMQIQSDTTPAVSPPFQLELSADGHLYVDIRSGTPNSGPGNVIWEAPNPIQPDQYYSIQASVSFNDNSSGYLDVWVNGTQVVNYKGPIGWDGVGPGGSALFIGPYGGPPPTFGGAVDYRNVTVTTGQPPLTSATISGSTTGTTTGTTSSGSTTASGGTPPLPMVAR
jgi:hypothetical protein